MEVLVAGKLGRILNDDAACIRKFGRDQAQKIKLRVSALRAAESLAAFWPPKSGPERVHELVADLAGFFSVDLKQPYRLILRPIEDPGKKYADQRERWADIKTVELVSVEDTHG